MSDAHSINLFLDEPLVDELWTLAKRDGLPIEKVREVSTKIEGKAKFGLGKFWQWMTSNVEAELKAGADGKFAQKLQLTSVFRALILPELIGEIARVGNQNGNSIDELNHGAFVEIETNTLELIPLPTFASYVRQTAIAEAGQSDKSASYDNEEANHEIDPDKAISFAEKFTSAQRALTFYSRLESSDRSSPLHKLFTGNSEEIFNALCMSNDDHVLGLSELSSPLLSVRDLKDAGGLVGRLKDAQNLLSQYLQEQFSSALRESLAAYNSSIRSPRAAQGSGFQDLLDSVFQGTPWSGPPPRLLQQDLVSELNRLLRSKSLYSKERFAHVKLSAETQGLLAQQPQSGELIRLNRSLLEDAYIGQIARSTESSAGAKILIFAVLEERYLKRNLAVFTAGRPIRIFGRVAYLRREGADGFLGIQPVSIVLG